ncbi:hypothetical protein BCR44DRAFT_1104160 [Catenaria anguillulae PL171]|uniref:EF-hand domain-containing protein n=1 Tax=Catenaria anguillulae PL171 TaxID=765915 RepID=A0A1Y2I2E9_9FUNG|nr:hypothetical protein BCR44DRAFT_1104160 [Catenaria anguillulae PL171]
MQSTPKRPIPDSVAEQMRAAQEYLDKHRILPVMHRLVELLVYHQPENPRQFMAEQLRKLAVARSGGSKDGALAHLSRPDLVNVFKIYDAAGKGMINAAQYAEAMAYLGLSATARKGKPLVSMDEFVLDAYVQSWFRNTN